MVRALIVADKTRPRPPFPCPVSSLAEPCNLILDLFPFPNPTFDLHDFVRALSIACPVSPVGGGGHTFVVTSSISDSLLLLLLPRNHTVFSAFVPCKNQP